MNSSTSQRLTRELNKCLCSWTDSGPELLGQSFNQLQLQLQGIILHGVKGHSSTGIEISGQLEIGSSPNSIKFSEISIQFLT